MQNNSSLKFWKLLVVILAILNVCLMFTIWYTPPRERRQTPFNYIVKELNMSQPQIDAYKQLRDWHHDSVMVLHKEGTMLRNSLFDNLKGRNADKRVTDSIIAIIGENQKKIENVTYVHFQQVRALCDDKQKIKFDNIINEVIKKMMQEGPPPGHGDGPPRGTEDGPPPPER